MERMLMRTRCERALTVCPAPTPRTCPTRQQRRWLATPTDFLEPIRAAAPISFGERYSGGANRYRQNKRLERMRVVPASPSYFTAVPRFTDDLLRLTSLLGRYKHLPMYARGEVPKVAWKSTEQYASEIQEPIKPTRFARLMRVIKRLNMIHASLMPQVILSALQRYKRVLQPFASRQKPLLIDEWGRSRGVGRRKSSNAHCYVVEGEGEIRVNGKTLTEYFNRVQDRESVIWALRATQRTDKYNVWAIAQGGGTTGQAEAVMLGVAKALLAHEPALKPALRRAGCLKRDPRSVERKKPGKLKARKMPAWVKR